jgi:hypothetical protein
MTRPPKPQPVRTVLGIPITGRGTAAIGDWRLQVHNARKAGRKPIDDDALVDEMQARLLAGTARSQRQAARTVWKRDKAGATENSVLARLCRRHTKKYGPRKKSHGG